MERLLEILNTIKPGTDFVNQTDLVTSGVLDSFSIVRLVSELEDEYDIEVTPVDIVPENFKTVSAILAMVERLEDE